MSKNRGIVVTCSDSRVIQEAIFSCGMAEFLQLKLQAM